MIPAGEEGAAYRKSYAMKYFGLGQVCQEIGEMRVKAERVTFRRFFEPGGLRLGLHYVNIAGK